MLHGFGSNTLDDLDNADLASKRVGKNVELNRIVNESFGKW